MEKSDFQFSNPFLTSLEFRINTEFDKEDSESGEINVTNSFSVNVKKSATLNEALVTLVIDINKDQMDSPFYLRAEMSALFEWNENIKGALLESMLSQNAPALLLAYARPIIANITNSSPLPAYDIPFFNFQKTP